MSPAALTLTPAPATASHLAKLKFSRVGLWNIGGGGVTGADSHWGHVEDALRPDGPLHDLDVLICTEAKLRDGTTIASLGQREVAAT